MTKRIKVTIGKVENNVFEGIWFGGIEAEDNDDAIAQIRADFNAYVNCAQGRLNGVTLENIAVMVRK